MKSRAVADHGSGRLWLDIDMDLRRKNILLAVLIGLFALGLYIYAIAHVMSDTGLPT